MTDFTKYNKTDREERTKIMARLIKAIEEDFALQGHNFHINPFNDRVNDTPGFELENKRAMPHGKSIGNRLLRGIPKGKSQGYSKGADVARVIAYVLTTLGRRQWPAVRTLVSELGPPWTELLDLQPDDPAELQSSIVSDALDRMDFRSGELKAELHALANRVGPLSDMIAALRNRLQVQDRTIRDTMHENTQLKVKIERIVTELQKLSDAAQAEVDEAKRQAMLETHAKLVNRLNKLLY
jgi:hypothetical protein